MFRCSSSRADLQRILGYDPLEVGLAFLPATLAMGTLRRPSEKLIRRFGPRRTLIVGLVVIGGGLLLFARTPVDGSYVSDVLPAMLLTGLGIGTSFPSLMTLAMSGATPEDAGLASGIVNTSAQVGGAIGLAVLATLASQRTDSQLEAGASHLSALNWGFHLAYLVGAALVAVALAVAVVVLRYEPVPEGAGRPSASRRASRPTRRARPTRGRSARSDLELVVEHQRPVRPAGSDLELVVEHQRPVGPRSRLTIPKLS